MTFQDRIKLTEASKDRFIDRNENLTDEQKLEIKQFFKKHPDQDNKIEWNTSDALQYKDFFEVMTTFNERFLPKLTLADLKEGEDYDYLGDWNNIKYYLIRNHKASVAFASNNIGPEVWSPLCDWYKNRSLTGEKTSWEENVLYDYPQKLDVYGSIIYGGAKWCISINHTDKFWNQYTEIPSTTNEKLVMFIFSINNSKNEKQAIQIAFYLNSSIGIKIDKIYDERDEDITDWTDNWDLQNISEFLNSERVHRIIDKYAEYQTNFLHQRIQKIEDYKDSLITKHLKFRNQDFPFFKVGEQAGCDISMSRYTTPIGVPCSFKYISNSYEDNINKLKYVNCYRWDTSIIRQWLNSDKSAGQWYQPPKIEGYDIHVDDINFQEKFNFTQNVDGFLKILGISKSDLNPIIHTTPCPADLNAGFLVTEDYVWIPTRAELGLVKNDVISPLDFWKQLSERPDYNHEMHCFKEEKSSMFYEQYYCRDITESLGYYKTQENVIYFVDDDGFVGKGNPNYFLARVVVLLSFK